MQLLCNGVVLDLPENAGLQFTHDNPLFAFDKMSCERTTEFALPSTPTNDRVLALARIPAYDGEGMRRKFDAQLQCGTVIQDGYLYVSAFDGSAYKATFVCGELVPLQKIKELGKIGEFMTYDDTIKVGYSPLSGYTARLNGWRWYNVRYTKPIADEYRPSINLPKIYEDVITAKSITAGALPGQAAHLWLVSVQKPINQDVHFICELNETDQPDADQPVELFNSLSSDDTIFDTQDTQYEVEILNLSQYYHVLQFKAKTDILLKMPDNWPSTMYVYDLSLQHDGGAYEHFYGDRSFGKDYITQTVTHNGDPLAGRSVKILAGECFSFVSEEYYTYFRVQDPMTGDWLYTRGFMLQNDPTFACDYTIHVQSLNDTLNVGEICRLQDNLPDITFVELLKVFAAVSGRVLNYDSVTGITFDELDISSWSTIDITGKVIKRGEVRRTFADYARANYILYASADDVRERVRKKYEVDNDNLAEEKQLQEIPFSEGDYADMYPENIFIHTDTNAQVLGADSSTEGDLLRVTLPTNAGLAALCNASTQVKMQVRMTLAEYNAITPKTKILCEGTEYVWTARSWQKDVADFTLAKI